MEYKRYSNEHDLGHVDGYTARHWRCGVVPRNKSERIAGNGDRGARQQLNSKPCRQPGHWFTEPAALLVTNWRATTDSNSDPCSRRRVVVEPRLRIGCR